jgi:BirA family biotin operon repressor/biotin-[acetyl-CoA-carboxylase] ligase
VVIRLRRVTSTQVWVRTWAQMGAREGLVLIAREQTAGRGRLDRSWQSPPGGLYLSLLLRPPIPLARANQLTMLVSLAAIDACRQVAGLQANPKWPNDLLLGRKKLAGVLTELENDGHRLRYAIIGLGLNVNNDFSGSELADTATSLRMAAGQDIDVDSVADAFLAALGRRYTDFLAGISPHHAWARNLEPLGRRVRVERTGRPPLRGIAESVSPEGALLVRDDAEALHTVWAGDVVIE